MKLYLLSFISSRSLVALTPYTWVISWYSSSLRPIFCMIICSEAVSMAAADRSRFLVKEVFIGWNRIVTQITYSFNTDIISTKRI
jgi:hypothetical protein